MAHTNCPNGHNMWNGDGKPIVYAFRVGFIKRFTEQFPDRVLNSGDQFFHMYDLCDELGGVPGEDLDCWYCDECKGLVVFVDNLRYDYQRLDTVPDMAYSDLLEWEDYIALRDLQFEHFQNFYEGKTPLEAVSTYDFEYRYKVSKDKKTIYAFDRDGELAFGYSLSSFMEFPND